MATFPFTAVVGQESLKTALLVAIVDPGINGVLISGSRGSAKSTLVRSLERLVPERQLVTLPLGATEEMVAGTLKLQKALQDGDIEFAPGLLARAHGGLLYVDEVNLLPDHLVDLLLDVAASGTNHVERDGISHRHEAEFVLVGTMNPDEGELRPQLLDRFGLMAGVQERFTLEERREIVRRRIAFEADPQAMEREHQPQTRELKERIDRAVRRLGDVHISQAMTTEIARRCEAAGVDGFRADITFYRAARAHAALSGRDAVTDEDLDAVEELVLHHRRDPDSRDQTGNPPDSPPPDDSGDATGTVSGSSIQSSWGTAETQAAPTGNLVSLPVGPQANSATPTQSKFALERTRARTSGAHRGTRLTPLGASREARKKPDWFRILSDPDNLDRRSHGGARRLHYRYPERRSLVVNLVLLDTSASTLGYGGLSRAKGAVKDLSRRSYLERARLGLITFGNEHVDTILPPQRARRDIGPVLDRVRGGGGTPFHRAIDYLDGLVGKLRRRGADCRIFILTDGKVHGVKQRSANLGDAPTTVVDIESGFVRLGRGRHLAARLGAEYVHVDTLDRRP